MPDPLQTLEPVTTPSGPALKNEMMLPAVLDPWAGHALFEAANLARQAAGSRVWLVSLAPKAKLQQVMMTVAQKAPFELVALDGPASGFTDSFETAAALAGAIEAIPGLDRQRLLLFGGWESASRGAGSTLQMVGERLGIAEQFQGVDQTHRGRRWQPGDPGAHRGRQAPGLGVRRAPGGAGMGHRQPAGAAQQSADRHGEHAGRDARAATRQAGAGLECRPDVRLRQPAETAARNARGEGHVPAEEIAREIVAWIGEE